MQRKGGGKCKSKRQPNTKVQKVYSEKHIKIHRKYRKKCISKGITEISHYYKHPVMSGYTPKTKNKLELFLNLFFRVLFMFLYQNTMSLGQYKLIYNFQREQILHLYKTVFMKTKFHVSKYFL